MKSTKWKSGERWLYSILYTLYPIFRRFLTKKKNSQHLKFELQGIQNVAQQHSLSNVDKAINKTNSTVY